MKSMQRPIIMHTHTHTGACMPVPTQKHLNMCARLSIPHRLQLLAVQQAPHQRQLPRPRLVALAQSQQPGWPVAPLTGLLLACRCHLCWRLSWNFSPSRSNASCRGVSARAHTPFHTVHTTRTPNQSSSCFTVTDDSTFAAKPQSPKMGRSANRLPKSPGDLGGIC